jgi:hypothetical protein
LVAEPAMARIVPDEEEKDILDEEEEDDPG